MGLKQLRSLALALLAIVTIRCADATRTSQQISARLDRIDVLIAKKDWEAARMEMRKALGEIPNLEAKDRLNAQAQLLTAGQVEESRAELAQTHISVGDLFAQFDSDEVSANRSHAGKEVRVTGEVGMVATDQFDRPYLTLHSKNTEFSVQAILQKHSAGALFADLVRVGDTVFVRCTCDGKSGKVIIMTRCSLRFPNANGMVPSRPKRDEIRKCGDGPRECA